MEWMENENDIGVIVKIYKSKVDALLVEGHLRRPQTKMGIGWFTFFCWMKPYNLHMLYSFITSSPLTSIIQAHKIDSCICMHRPIMAPFMYYVSQFNIKFIPSLLLFVLVSL